MVVVVVFVVVTVNIIVDVVVVIELPKYQPTHALNFLAFELTNYQTWK